jgi:hypothetical protein
MAVCTALSKQTSHNLVCQRNVRSSASPEHMLSAAKQCYKLLK